MNRYKVVWFLFVLALPTSGCVTATKPGSSEEAPSKKTILSEKPRTANISKISSQTHERTRATVISRTVYYLGSPQQGHPPEGVFEAGTLVTIELDNGGYVKVSADNGVTAWVSASSLKRLKE